MSLPAHILARWLPSTLCASTLREAEQELLLCIHGAVPPPSEGVDPIAAAMERLGERLGGQLRRRLKLPPSRSGAILAWRIASRLGGLRFQVRKEAERTIIDHHHCPLWERFRREGELSCARFCTPLARGMARSVAPECTMEMVRPATLERPCAKALKGA